MQTKINNSYRYEYLAVLISLAGARLARQFYLRRDMIITIMIEPVPKPTITRKQNGQVIVRSGLKKYWAFRDELQAKLKQSPGNCFDVIFVKAMPKSWPKYKKLEKLGQPHDQKPDRDNFLKALQDALTDEDKTIYGGEVFKFWGERSCIILSPRPDEDLASVLARWQEEEVLTNLKTD